VRPGGGVAEAYPQDTAGKKVRPSFLYNPTRSMFERAAMKAARRAGTSGYCSFGSDQNGGGSGSVALGSFGLGGLLSSMVWSMG
jgi:hypothetical protein